MKNLFGPEEENWISSSEDHRIQVSDLGNVQFKGKPAKISISGGIPRFMNKYLKVLVYQAFTGDNAKWVECIDGNELNCRFDNLRAKRKTDQYGMPTKKIKKIKRVYDTKDVYLEPHEKEYIIQDYERITGEKI